MDVSFTKRGRIRAKYNVHSIGKLKQSLDFVEFLFCARLFFVILTVFLGGRHCDYHCCNSGETEAQHVLFSKDMQ